MFSHVVMKGQSLSRIAEMYNVSIEMILAVNPNITDPDCIFIGQVIQIPFVQATPCWSYPGHYTGVEPMMSYPQMPQMPQMPVAGVEMGYPQMPVMGTGMGHYQMPVAGMEMGHHMPVAGVQMSPYPVNNFSVSSPTGVPMGGTGMNPLLNFEPNTQVNPYLQFNPYTDNKFNFEFNPKTQLQFNPSLDFDLNLGGSKK